ncbi:beta-ketoacyl synthase N-terminal-like domain-containing protein [Streptomyces chartreusis]|uniref:beta-ketoacyl synthase N-terminal-like domain-containing protein n=1 Tax=Streptomyces chartreusis TaxID=1969 RepID=UPI003695CDE6
MLSPSPQQPPIAIIGMAGRYPRCRDASGLWSMLAAGHEAVRRFSKEELLAAGIPPATVRSQDYMPFGADLTDIELFDAEFFDITPAEATLMDPQQRIFLECVSGALDNAGIGRTDNPARIGVFSSSARGSYVENGQQPLSGMNDGIGSYALTLGNSRDFLSTKISYQLNLHGPSMTVQTACSSSLVAVDLACMSLAMSKCDVAIVGGVSVARHQVSGYLYQEGGILSADGHCRPFDAAASGTVKGNGCGVVILKRLDNALADHDYIYAVIAGSAVNNDGMRKVGFTAPSTQGQVAAMRDALAASGIAASTVDYLEAHGTGTYVGDPIEFSAFQQVYGSSAGRHDPCEVGSIKANVGHLDSAAGITGLIKAALILHHQIVPPQVNFTAYNPQLADFEDHGFRIHTGTESSKEVKAAAVTSLGLGGTNAHVVLERAPCVFRADEARGPYVLRVSGRDGTDVRDRARGLIEHLETFPHVRLDDVAYSLSNIAGGNRATVNVLALNTRHAMQELAKVAVGQDYLPVSEALAVSAEKNLSRSAWRTPLPGRKWRRKPYWLAEIEQPVSRESGRLQHRNSAADSAMQADWPDILTIVKQVFCETLRLPVVDDGDDFSHLGGNSLLAVEATSRLNKACRQKITVSKFISLGTANRLAHHLEQADNINSGCLTQVRESQSDQELFLVHPSGGSDSFVHRLAAVTESNISLYSFSYPSGQRSKLLTIQQMAEQYVQELLQQKPNGPYLLGGYSLGGLIALEMCHQLSTQGHQVQQLFLFDTLPPGSQPPMPESCDLVEAYIYWLSAMLEFTPPPGRDLPSTLEPALEFVRQPSWSDEFLVELREIFENWRIAGKAIQEFKPIQYSGSVVLFAAENPIPIDHPLLRIKKYDADEWRNHLTGEFDVRAVSGNHFSMFSPRYIRGLAAAFDSAVAEMNSTTRMGSHSTTRTGESPTVILFPGGGSQCAGMGAELFSEYPDLLAEADEILGYSIADICRAENREALSVTRYAFPAIYTVNALLYREYIKENPPPEFLLGHSLGEYNALEAAGIVDFGLGLRLVVRRGEHMARVRDGAMLAVMGLTEPEIIRLIEEHALASVDIAAFNARDQFTLSGLLSDISSLEQFLRKGGVVARMLNIDIPAHSRHMNEAARRFKSDLKKCAFSLGNIPVISNVTARPHLADDVADSLFRHVTHPVLWWDSLQYVIDQRSPRFVELGARHVLSPMLP